MESNREVLADIAKRHLSIERLDTQRSDRLDFYDLAVWRIEQALGAAFEAGLDAAADRRTALGEKLLGRAQNPDASDLSYPGRVVFEQVLAAMQDAEEIGGPEKSEYVDLMIAIIREASRRIAYYATHALPSDGTIHNVNTNHEGDEP